MALSVSCPNCGKRFENIKPEHAGKKAKCGCGEIVRLGVKPTEASSGDASPMSDDLMDVDLLGDELLGDELLGDVLLDSERSVSASLNSSSGGQKPVLRSAVEESAASKDVPKDVPKDVAKVTPTVSNKRSRREKKRPPQKSVNAVSIPVAAPNPVVEEPIFNQSYSDLESILEGKGDAAPIVVRPPEQSRNDEAQEESESKRREGSPVGFLAALLSGTLAFWFGVFAVVSKFKVIDQLLASSFSRALHRVYTAQFGSLELSEGYQTLFSVFGWLFWALAICLMVLGATQFLNSLYRLLTKRHFFRRIDGLTATCAVVVLFLIVGWVFAQASLQRDQHKFLSEYERPATANGGQLEVVTQLRAEVDSEHQATRNWLLAGALVPMSIFVLSMTRLLTLKPDRRSGSSE